MKPVISTSPDRVRTPLAIDFPRIGTVRPRSASEIGPSNWTLGCEVLDRDFADWDEYKDYIPPLGLKTIRLQSGWAKCERVKGTYDFAWLDHIVDDAIARGIEPILETGYGNPVYPGGGGFDLGAGFPVSDEGLAAWDAWVDAIARHFRGRVRDWFMWNEPDTKDKTPEMIAAFNVRTARIVKKAIPDARIAGLSLARNQPAYFEECLRALGSDIALFDWFIYHGYNQAPEGSYRPVEIQKAIAAKYAPHAKLRQGENGAPSEMAAIFALKRIPWSEYSQAKWNLRRMLADFGHGVLSSAFTISDFNHKGKEINHKGLLRADNDHHIIGIKRAWYATQNLASVFGGGVWETEGCDDSPGEPDFCADPARGPRTAGLRSTDLSLSTYSFRRSDTGARALAFWVHGCDISPELDFSNAPKGHVREPDDGRILQYTHPGNSFETRPAVFEDIGGEPLRDPVWVDLLTGRVYDYDKANVIPCRDRVTYLEVPVYDSPCLLIERDSFAWDGRF